MATGRRGEGFRGPEHPSTRDPHRAARPPSFIRGAAEFRVTRAAVSRRVKALEQHPGLQRLQLPGHRPLPTDRGQLYFPAVREALERLEGAPARPIRAVSRRRVTIRAAPSPAARRLTPRLGRSGHIHLEIELRAAPTAESVYLRPDDVDLSMCRGDGRAPGLRADRTPDRGPGCALSSCPAASESGLERPETRAFRPWILARARWDT